MVFAAVTVALLLVIGFAGYQRYSLALDEWLAGSSPRATPKGQAPLTVLDASSFHQLRDLFNSTSDRTRVLALLSPK